MKQSLQLSLVLLLAGAATATMTALIGCGRHAEEAAAVSEADDSFELTVMPVLAQSCGACHGVSPQELERVAAKVAAREILRWEVTPDGAIPKGTPMDQARAACRLWLNADGPLLASPLLRAPLAAVWSGMTHPAVFENAEDANFLALVEWAKLARPASAGEAAASAAEAFFAEKVVPILERKTCFGANCHGSLAFNDLRLDAGMPLLGAERLTPAIVHADRMQMLGKTTRLVNLSGDVERSRQLLKCIPIEQGGIAHKGGNNFLAKGDPDYLVLVQWLELEAQEARTRSAMPEESLGGYVFVRRPRATPERFFEDADFLPGGDLIWTVNGAERNLTVALHPDGPADVRAPDVSYDGKRVAFAMRRAATEPFQIWEMDLATAAARQLTFGQDPQVHCLDPLYVPDPSDKSGTDLARVNLVFVSNRAGEWCASSPEGTLGEAESGTESEILDEQRTEKPGAFDGRQLRVLLGAAAGDVRRVLRSETGRLILDAPLSVRADSTTHYLIEGEPRIAPKYDLWRIPLAELGGERQTWDAGPARMTWSPSQIRRPAMRSSGEVMFTSLRTGWQAGRPFFNGAVFRVHVDGSNFHTHNGNRSGVPILADNRECPDGLEIRIGCDAGSWWGGALLISDHQFGPTIEPDNPVDNLDHPYRDGLPESSLTRFVPGWVSLDRAALTRGVSPGGAYRNPYPLADGSILVSWAPGPINLSDPSEAPDFDVLRLSPDPAFRSADGAGPGTFRREVLISGPETELWARPVAPRLKEPTIKTLKTEEKLLGAPHPSHGYLTYPEGTPAVVEIYDLPLLAAFFEQVTPVGLKHIAAPICPLCGEANGDADRIEGVRLVGALPQREGDRGEPLRVVLAEERLERDGSSYLTIPSGIAFDVQALNALGMAVAMPNRWLYCLPGERHTLSIPRVLFPQTCGGCHGGLSGQREDILRYVDGITAASRTLAVWDDEAEAKPKPVNWSGVNPGFKRGGDFEQDVRPILTRKCVSCHAELAGDGARAWLLPHVEAREAMAVRSALIEKLIGRELHAPQALTGDAPHPSSAPLSAAELREFILWVDLGAAPGSR